ncbi:MAG: FAD:protein FMN transferase [Bacteroidales bacterium]|nr:FAD:protein FMN transferase [Bacteroidales bacterium]
MLKHKTNKSQRHHTVVGFLILSIVVAAIASSCTSPVARINGTAQGTYYTISYIDPKNRDLQPAIDSILTAFDSTASLWVEGSLLRRVNANLTDSLNPLLADMITKSLQMADYTQGAFDIRVGRLVQAWGFSFREQQQLSDIAIDSLLHYAQGDVVVNGLKLIKQYPETELDLNAIAQGYSVDLLAQWFDSIGIHNYLIDVGGEVIAKGKKGHNMPWRVGIEQPADNAESMPIIHTAIPLINASVVTSGNYRKYYEKDGIKYSHTIDPTTGRPVTHSLLSASVIAPTAWQADAMATAYMVMGVDRAKTFISQHKGQLGTSAVLLIYDSLGTMKTYSTPEFDKLQQQ